MFAEWARTVRRMGPKGAEWARAEWARMLAEWAREPIQREYVAEWARKSPNGLGAEWARIAQKGLFDVQKSKSKARKMK